MMDDCLNRRRLTPEDLVVTSATLVFEFGELRGRKAGTARVNVSQTGPPASGTCGRSGRKSS